MPDKFKIFNLLLIHVSTTTKIIKIALLANPRFHRNIINKFKLKRIIFINFRASSLDICVGERKLLSAISLMRASKIGKIFFFKIVLVKSHKRSHLRSPARWLIVFLEKVLTAWATKWAAEWRSVLRSCFLLILISSIIIFIVSIPLRC